MLFEYILGHTYRFSQPTYHGFQKESDCTLVEFIMHSTKHPLVWNSFQLQPSLHPSSQHPSQSSLVFKWAMRFLHCRFPTKDIFCMHCLASSPDSKGSPLQPLFNASSRTAALSLSIVGCSHTLRKQYLTVSNNNYTIKLGKGMMNESHG